MGNRVLGVGIRWTKESPLDLSPNVKIRMRFEIPEIAGNLVPLILVNNDAGNNEIRWPVPLAWFGRSLGLIYEA